ncbi:MAG: YggS family pyridoxal phosphate-dependent enzyme [Proteobacteria bacterium]|nr:YggS family pyridoxal phosphate-dependent enzyme [Pseudomonadota bacterium]
MADIAVNLENVRAMISAFAREFDRDPEVIRLLAVSKTHPPAGVIAALESGQRDFGENYLQEALPKMATLAGCGARWHYIGRIQTNKTRDLAAAFDWVQTVDREKVAQRLNDQRPESLPPLNVCLQVNIDREPQKAGALPDSLAGLAAAIRAMPRLRLRGLMAIPAETTDFEAQRNAFAAVRRLFEQLHDEGHELDTLSMGMSGDMRAAIAEGSTLLRIGTAIFGPRTRND